MKNHYVSQLILKRFANALYIFDDNAKSISKHTQTENIFYKKDIYTDEVETAMNFNLENDFAKLLDKKVLGKNKITLTRTELLLLKRYLLVCSIKTKTPDEFIVSIRNFKSNTERYLKLLQHYDNIKYSSLMLLPSIDDIDDTPFNLQMRAMELFINCNTEAELIFHPLCVREFYAWAKVFLDAFLTFCDSHPRHEFILTDNGMTSEYEPSHYIFEGISLSKHSYLMHCLKSDDSEVLKARYCDLLLTNEVMFENFNIFNLSSTRCIVLAHPFFRLYDDKGMRLLNDQETYKYNKPDIWPSIFETREIINTPENIYTVPNQHSMDDKFIYTPCKLSVYDTIHINVLILSQTKNLIGFNDYKKVVDSLATMSAFKAVNNKKMYEDDAWLGTLVDILLSDSYNYIYKYFKDDGSKCSVSPFKWLDHYALMALKDTRQNKYILQHLLDNEKSVLTMKNFDFMGSPAQRIELIKADLRKLS
ncbi:MAG: DUF4238 domain-containing protein [Candidatus Gastranaerophilales bacterium]|nr:DUF4238 domain-containing protein [Candidatus Gastranaerophilales bacterium]